MDSFKRWMAEVNRIIESDLGFDAADLRSRDWWRAFNDCRSPADAVANELSSLDEIASIENQELFQQLVNERLTRWNGSRQRVTATSQSAR